MRGLATRTDAFVAPPATTRERRDGYFAVSTPGCRDYYFGNLLILDDPPSPEGLES